MKVLQFENTITKMKILLNSSRADLSLKKKESMNLSIDGRAYAMWGKIKRAAEKCGCL